MPVIVKATALSQGSPAPISGPAASAAAAARVASKMPGRREANKLEKLLRIQRAAHELFVLQGYDSTTMRMIADHAGVALGTLFVYAWNKRDLLFLIANDIMVAAVDEASSLVFSGGGLVENLTMIAGVHFRAFGNKPELFRLVLRELLFYDSGHQATRAADNRHRFLLLLKRVVGDAARAGEIQSTVDAELAARVFFAIIQADIRAWLAKDRRTLASGLMSFSMAISLIINGFAARPPAPAATASEIKTIVSRLRCSPAKG